MLQNFALICHRASQGAVVVLMSAILVIVVVQITLRYGLGTSLTWSEEVVRCLLIWLTFVGASAAVREGSLVGLDLLQRAADRAGFGRLLAVLVLALSLVFVLAAAYWGYQLAMSPAIQRQSFSTLDLPMTLVYGAIPASMGFMAIQLTALIASEISPGKVR